MNQSFQIYHMEMFLNRVTMPGYTLKLEESTYKNHIEWKEWKIVTKG